MKDTLSILGVLFVGNILGYGLRELQLRTKVMHFTMAEDVNIVSGFYKDCQGVVIGHADSSDYLVRVFCEKSGRVFVETVYLSPDSMRTRNK